MRKHLWHSSPQTPLSVKMDGFVEQRLCGAEGLTMRTDMIGKWKRHSLSGPATTDTALAEFQNYWQNARRRTSVPRRSDIEPRGIEPLLANAFVIERIAPGLARLRVAGSHLSDLMGMEVRGMPISALINPASRDGLSEYLAQLFDQPAMLHLSLASGGRPSAPALSGTMALLPLESDRGEVSRALGCLISSGKIGRGPRRFDITDAVVNPLDSEDAGATPTLSSRCPDGARHASERPYLRLVKG